MLCVSSGSSATSSRKSVPPSACSNSPFPVLHSPRESASNVAEKLALEQSWSERCAVHSDERRLRAVAFEMNRACYELFSGAALSADEHCGIGLTHVSNRLKGALHRLITAHKAVKLLRIGREENGLGKAPLLHLRRAGSDQDLDSAEELAVVV